MKRLVSTCLVIILFFSLASSAAYAESYSPAAGDYYIVSALDCGKVVDVSGGSNANCANIQLYDFNGSKAQIFRLSHAGNGYYTIRNQGSKKYVDVAGGVKKSSTNVWQYTYNGTDPQLWSLVDAGDGFYYIRSKLGFYMDVAGAETANETNIQVYTGNKTKAQKFQLVPVKAPVESEKYYIESALEKNKVLDIKNSSGSNGANLQLYQANNTGAQLFELSFSNGYYTIKNCSSRKVIDVTNGENVSGNNVQQYTYNGSPAQKWYLEPAGQGYYYIRSQMGLYLDVSNAGTKNETNIQIYTGNRSAAQKFRFIPYVNYTYSTVRFDCSSPEKWRNSVLASKRGLQGILVGQEVLSWKTITVKIPYGPVYQGSSYYVIKKLKLPYEVKYKLHTHSLNQGYGHSWVYRNNSIILTEQCSCGYYKEVLAWEIPELAAPVYSQRTLVVNNKLPVVQTTTANSN